MRKIGIPLLTIAVGVLIGFLIAAPRTPAPVEAVAGTGFAAVPGEKGGQELFGAYEPVVGWPKSLDTLPGHEGWSYGSAEGIFPESPNRVFMVQRGELPIVKEPENRPVPGFGYNISWPAGAPWRNATSVSPGNGDAKGIIYNGKLGVDARWEHNIVVADAEGNIIEEDVWRQWDQMFRRPHSVYVNPYDPQKHIWVVDDTGHSIRKFTNDGKQLVLTLGTPYESGDDENHFNRPTFIAWLPDSTMFVSDGYANTRVMKFDAQGTYLTRWGQKGTPPDTRPGYFNSVHGIAVDPPTRRVFVNDRTNRRVQVFDENGMFLDQWAYGKAGTSDAHSILMGGDRNLWVIDRTSSRMVKYDLDGHLLYSWGVYGPDFPGGFWGVHQASVDSEGNFYTAEVNAGRFQKYRPRPNANPAMVIQPVLASQATDTN